MRFSLWPNPERTFDETRRLVLQAEDSGWHAAYVADHFMDDRPIGESAEAATLESTATLAALAASTTRIRLGTLVASATYRHPAVLAAWAGNRDNDIIPALEAPMNVLRALLAEKAPRTAGTPRKPREGTKQEAVLTLLRRTEGATIAQIMETTAWASHTCRGFLAGLKKKGIKIDTLERVRMVGPNRDGAKGAYTVYAITD